VPAPRPAQTRSPVTNPGRSPRSRRPPAGADVADVEKAPANAVAAQPAWDRDARRARAKILEHAADLLEARMPEFIALMCAKPARRARRRRRGARGGRLLPLLRAQARKHDSQPIELPGPTGESNQNCQLHGRGVFVCISPWNFPLAIFMGQVAAALAAGNSVIAKPAEQTNLIGYAR
jgi:RHH-type proline utilization regulon transcriptional repressor/proline dehydrogenase/delta 1-pyrroline-5-carboxylate dehydrogenase